MVKKTIIDTKTPGNPGVFVFYKLCMPFIMLAKKFMKRWLVDKIKRTSVVELLCKNRIEYMGPVLQHEITVALF